MKNETRRNYNIIMSAEVGHVKRTVWKIAVLMLLVPALFSTIIFGILLKKRVTADWKDLYESTVQLSKIATGDFINDNYIRKQKTGNFEEDMKDLEAGAVYSALDRLYVLDPYDMTYYDIVVRERKQRATYGKFYQRLSGCLDENGLTDEQRKRDTDRPVYSWDISGTSIKAWTRIRSTDGIPFVLCTEYPIEDVITDCIRITWIIFGLSILISNLGYLLVYSLVLKKMVKSVSQLSDDLDSYHATGKITDRPYPDRMVEKLRQDFLLLANNNTEYTRVKCEEAREEGSREQRNLTEARAETLFCPEKSLTLSGKRQGEISVYKLPRDAARDDLCDYMMLGPDKVGFVIASLPKKNNTVVLPVYLRAVFRSAFTTQKSLEKMAYEISGEIRRIFGEECLCKAFFGRMDGSGNLRFINAGYNIPFVCCSGEKLQFLPGNCGPALGSEDGVFLQESVDLMPGTLLVCCSDGEGEDAAGREKMKAMIDGFTRDRKNAPGEYTATALREYLEKENREPGKTALIIKG